MIARILRLRAKLGLDPRKPLVFLSKANAICNGLGDKTLFPTPVPPVATLQLQIQNATTAQQNMGTVKGAGPARDAAFQIVGTSLESERMMIQGLCDVNPEQAATLIAAAAMTPSAIGLHNKALLAAKTGPTSGTVLLEANASLLDDTNRKKFFNWQGTLDGGKTFFAMPSTPTGQTSIGNLVPLATIGFQVSVTVHKQPQGPWSQIVYFVVH
jgi:hypothetical protein